MDSTQQVQAIRALSSEIPLNDFGMPTGIYRTDLLPYHNYRLGAPIEEPIEEGVLIEHSTLSTGSGEDSDFNLDLTSGLHTEREIYRIAGFPAEELHGAFMPLQFDEGFPAFDNGQPFWSRLEYEPSDAFEAFQKYIHMGLGTPGTIPDYDDLDATYNGTQASGLRNISILVADNFPDNEILRMVQRYQQYFHLYYWGMRAHAYDLYRIAQYRTQQELRMVETQDEHYVQTRRLRHRLMQYMNDEEEFWDMMTPKTGLDMFKTLTSLERVSAGLPASGPASEATEGNRGTPFEVTLRSVAQTNKRIQKNVINEDGEALDRALEDPDATEILQELIIKTGGY